MTQDASNFTIFPVNHKLQVVCDWYTFHGAGDILLYGHVPCLRPLLSVQNGIWPRETKYMSIHVRVSRISVGDDKQRGGVEPDVALGITDTRQISTSFGFSCWHV